jgi:putative acetyltransferase
MPFLSTLLIPTDRKVMLRIVSADNKEAVHQVSALFREYAEALGVDLSFQNFERELAELPGEYAPPHGALLLAFDEASPASSVPGSPALFAVAGCVALRKIDRDICEMKRLYVRGAFRGRGMGRALALAIMDTARTTGYRAMRLDTLPQMGEAQALYSSLGFRDIPPYRFNPISGSRFLEIALA